MPKAVGGSKSLTTTTKRAKAPIKAPTKARIRKRIKKKPIKIHSNTPVLRLSHGAAMIVTESARGASPSPRCGHHHDPPVAAKIAGMAWIRVLFTMTLDDTIAWDMTMRKNAN